ncbi:MAG: hypothetical protein NT049_15675 [Planctomycetota bacterium]|nr:hypothetical protein [Planctomycetota bacterium]
MDPSSLTYQPGANIHVYWLCIEGHGGDDDYKEAMIHVSEQKDGSFSLDISSGDLGSAQTLVSKPEGVVLLTIPANASGLHVTLKPSDDSSTSTSGGGATSPFGKNQDDDPVASTVVNTSYAMNVYYPQMVRKGTKILLMDYTRYLAYVNDDWYNLIMDPKQTGTPIFARHGGRMNVLYADGAVVAEDPKDVNPAVPSIETALWDP